MAAVSDCFTIGSIVWCRTCHQAEIEGEVMAFDEQTRILILKCRSHCGNPKLNNVHFVNLSLVSELQVKKEVTTVPEAPLSLNLQRLNTRIRNQVEQKQCLIQAMSANVPLEGQKLFIAMSKTIKEVRWRNKDIIVLSEIVISPPYTIDNISGNPNSQAYSYIKKMVEKLTKDSNSINSQNNSTQQIQNTTSGTQTITAVAANSSTATATSQQ